MTETHERASSLVPSGRALKHVAAIALAALAALAVVGTASARPGDKCGAGGPCPVPAPAAAVTAVPQGSDRYIFCAVAGNTTPDGSPIAPGTSLNLPADQVTTDAHYMGATIGFFQVGLGATCQLTPQQASIAAASTRKVNHLGGTGDINLPEVYTLVG